MTDTPKFKCTTCGHIITVTCVACAGRKGGQAGTGKAKRRAKAHYSRIGRLGTGKREE